MKKIFSVLTIVVLAVILAACDRRPVLKVFLPLEYMGEDFIAEFNKNSEYRVELIEFESNEDMLSKYNTSTYDLIIPSDYALEELVSKDALLEMDWSRIDTFKQKD